MALYLKKVGLRRVINVPDCQLRDYRFETHVDHAIFFDCKCAQVLLRSLFGDSWVPSGS